MMNIFIYLLIVFSLFSAGCGSGSSTNQTSATTTSTISTTSTSSSSTSTISSTTSTNLTSTTTTSSSSTTNQTTTTTTTSTTTTTNTNFPYVFHLKEIDSTTSTECYRNPPTLANNNIYIGTSRRAADSPKADNYFIKLDQSLNLAWAYTLEAYEVRGAAVLDSSKNIYFLACNRNKQYLYSLTDSGALRWKYQIASSYQSQGIWTPLINSNDEIYLTYPGKTMLFDNNGNLIWEIQNGGSSSAIMDSSGKLYFSATGAVYCYNGSLEVWSATIDNGSESHGTPAFSTDEAYVYASARATLAKIERATGNVVWLFTAEASDNPPYFRASPAIDSENNLYVGTKFGGNSKFYAINSDGSQKWVVNVGYDLYSSPAIANNNIIYVGSESSQIQAFNMSDGSSPSNFPLMVPGGADITWSSPVISSSGIVYLANMSSYDAGSGDNAGSAAYVFGLETNSTGLDQTAAWPCYMGNNARTGKN